METRFEGYFEVALSELLSFPTRFVPVLRVTSNTKLNFCVVSNLRLCILEPLHQSIFKPMPSPLIKGTLVWCFESKVEKFLDMCYISKISMVGLEQLDPACDMAYGDSVTGRDDEKS